MSISRGHLLNRFSLVVVLLAVLLLLLIPGLVNSQSTNTCLQVFTNYDGDLAYDENNDGKVNLHDCMTIIFPPGLETVISDANATLLDLANDPNPDIEQMQSVSIQRSAALLELIPQDPGGAYDVLLSEADRNTILTAANNDPVVVENIEEPFNENGTLTIVTWDLIDIDVPHIEVSETYYELEVETIASNNDGGLLNKLAEKLVGKVHASTTATYLIHSAQPMPNVSSNSNVDVVGMELFNLAIIGNDSASSSITVVQEQPVVTTGERQVLYLPVYFSDTEDDPATPDFNEQEPLSTSDLTDINDLIDDQLFEASYGKSWLSATIMPAIEIIMETPTECDDGIEALHAEVMHWSVFANDFRVDYAPFEDGSVVVLYPNVPECKEGVSDVPGGIASVGVSEINTNEGVFDTGRVSVNMANWVFIRQLYAHTIFHELGHNYGLNHANFLKCGPDDEIGSLQDCFSIDHEDIYDMMGYWMWEGWQTNLLHREHLGWLESQYINEVEVYAQQEYLLDIVPRGLQPQPAGSTYLVKFNSDTLPGGKVVQAYTEYIQPIGYDNYVPLITTSARTVFDGATIHVKSEYVINEGFSHLVDTTPGSSTDPDLSLDALDAQLLPGESVTFPYVFGVTVEVCSADPDGLQIAINRSCEVDTNIVFSSDMSGISSIYTAELDIIAGSLSNITQIQSGFDPSVSINGTTFVYVWRNPAHDDNTDIYRVPGVNISDHYDPDYYPSISPNGSQVAWSSMRDGDWDIYIDSTSGGSPVNLTNDTDGNPDTLEDITPSFNHDGTKIIFNSSTTSGPGTSGVYTMNLDGSGKTQIYSGSEGGFEFDYSPDGTKIVYEGRVFGTFWYDLHIINSDGTGHQQLTSDMGHNNHPTFSQDGTKIIFSGTRYTGNAQLWMINLDGSDPVNITVDPSAQYFAPEVFPQ